MPPTMRPLALGGFVLLGLSTMLAAGPFDRIVPGLRKEASRAREDAMKEMERLVNCCAGAEGHGARAAAACLESRRTADKLVAEGDRQFDDDDYGDARDLFQKARREAETGRIHCEAATLETRPGEGGAARRGKLPENKEAKFAGRGEIEGRIRKLAGRLDAAERYLKSARAQLAEATDAAASNPDQARDLLDMAEFAVKKARKSLE